MNTGKTNRQNIPALGGKGVISWSAKSTTLPLPSLFSCSSRKTSFYRSVLVQASKRTSGITFLTWSPQNMAVFPSTSATSERSLGQAWFFFFFVLKTHLFCLRTATFQFKAPTPNYRDNCRNARCILHHHHRMPPNAPSINSDEFKKKKK